MPTVTRTTNPLPFEHLEPKRFEDLVRQLAYDFRPWRALEATGTGGSDDSFDIRGWEIVGIPPDSDTEEDEDNPQDATTATKTDHLWLIQCKRETEIGPTKLVRYVDAIPEEQAAKLYGVIVAASCTLSMKARDKFRERCAARGFKEFYLWSRSELEDMLFQPKNDGLLFAYFGFSLTLRRRAAASNIRARLSAKRKVIRAFDSTDFISRPVIIVDVNSDYPYRDFEKQPLDKISWRLAMATQHYERGIELDLFRYSAYIDENFKEWDIAPFVNHSIRPAEIFWLTQEEGKAHQDRLTEVDTFMDTLPPERRANCNGTAFLPYERIIDIDKYGDTLLRRPIIYVEYDKPGVLGIPVKAVITGRSHLIHGDDGVPRSKRFTEQELEVFEADVGRIIIFPEHMRTKIF